MSEESAQQQVVSESSTDGGESFGNLGDPNRNFKLPGVDEVWKLIEQMEGISDEERASIRDSLYNPQEGTPEEFLKRYAQPEMGHTQWDYILFFVMLAVIVTVLALFGYKLYKSLMDKELKKKEKLKIKQSKKSKKSN